MKETDKLFAGSIPEFYDRYLGPLIFAPYADDLAARVARLAPKRVLETAAGTGIATRALAQALPETASIVATDLNPAMIDFAAAKTKARNVSWRQADALALPFEDGAFDAVACQFGVMFFPDKRAGYREALRVLAPGGRFVFSVWDRIEDNEVPRIVTDAVAALFPGDPPRFLARTPHGHHDTAPSATISPWPASAASTSRPSRSAAARPRIAIPPSASARAPRCATRSKPAIPPASPKPPKPPPPPSPPASAPAPSTERSRPTSSPPPASRRPIDGAPTHLRVAKKELPLPLREGVGGGVCARERAQGIQSGRRFRRRVADPGIDWRTTRCAMVLHNFSAGVMRACRRETPPPTPSRKLGHLHTFRAGLAYSPAPCGRGFRGRGLRAAARPKNRTIDGISNIATRTAIDGWIHARLPARDPAP